MEVHLNCSKPENTLSSHVKSLPSAETWVLKEKLFPTSFQGVRMVISMLWTTGAPEHAYCMSEILIFSGLSAEQEATLSVACGFIIQSER